MHDFDTNKGAIVGCQSRGWDTGRLSCFSDSHYPVIMALGLVDDTLLPSMTQNEKVPSKSIVPDGLKTFGQHPPLYDELSVYENFPEQITGKTVWDADDYMNSPERWEHRMTEEEIVKLSDAADRFKAAV